MNIKWNEYTWYSKLAAIVFFVAVLPAWTFYLGVKYQETIIVSNLQNDTFIAHKGIKELPQANSTITTKLNQDANTLSIYSNGNLIYTLSTKDIPVFDKNYDTELPTPDADYFFSWLSDQENKPLIDTLRNRIYINIFNRTTAGNANASHALFAYNISNDKVELISTFFGTGGNAVSISKDNKYLIALQGEHGGACANSTYLEIINLENNKSVGNVQSTFSASQGISFTKWIDNKSFEYKESGFNDEESCITDQGQQLGMYFKEKVGIYTIKDK